MTGSRQQAANAWWATFVILSLLSVLSAFVVVAQSSVGNGLIAAVATGLAWLPLIALFDVLRRPSA